MKKTTLIFSLLLATALHVMAQFDNLKKDLNKVVQGQSSQGFSEEEAGKAIKEALNKGIERGVSQLSKPDGYFKDLSIKILMPPTATKVEDKLRSIGQDKLVDDAIESMNRGAEDAANLAKDIFVEAIKNLSIKEAINIVKGPDNAATEYLKKETSQKLKERFMPIIKSSLEKVGATKYWNSVMTTYNQIPFVDKVNPNLEEYVTDKAIEGLFVQIAKEETNIRKNAAARTTELLKKVFK